MAHRFFVCAFLRFMNISAAEYQSNKGMSSKSERPQKTFFFERPDGSTFSVNEAEAWNVYTGKNQIVGFQTVRPKLIGVSDGSKVAQAIIEAKEIFKTEGFEKAQQRVKQGHEEEIESARGHIEKPRNFDMVDSRGNPVRLQDLQ